MAGNYLPQLTAAQLQQLISGSPLVQDGWKYGYSPDTASAHAGQDNWVAPSNGYGGQLWATDYLGDTSGLKGGMAPDGTQNIQYDEQGRPTEHQFTTKYDPFMNGDWSDTLAMLAAGGFGAGFGALAGVGGAGAGVAGAGGEAAGSGFNPWAAGFTDTGTAGGALDAGYAGSGALTGAGGAAGAAGGAGTAAGAAGGVAGGGGTLGSVLGGGGAMSGLLGPALAVLGAATGAKGQNATQTSTQSMTPELKPYVFGPGGLLPGAQSLFQQQTAPGGMPGYTQMQNVGMGLLSQPVAGNGFAQFQQRRLG